MKKNNKLLSYSKENKALIHGIYIYLYILKTEHWTAGELAWQSPPATQLADNVYHKIKIIYRAYTPVQKDHDFNSSPEKTQNMHTIHYFIWNIFSFHVRGSAKDPLMLSASAGWRVRDTWEDRAREKKVIWGFIVAVADMKGTD